MNMYKTKLQIEELKQTNYNLWLACSTQAKRCDKIIRNFKHPITKKFIHELASGILLPGTALSEAAVNDPCNYFSPYAPEECNRPSSTRFYSRLAILRKYSVLQLVSEGGKKVYQVNPAWLDTYAEAVTVRPADTPSPAVVAAPSAPPEPAKPSTPPFVDLLKEMAGLPIAEVKLVAGSQQVRLENVNLEAVYRVAKVYKETFGQPAVTPTIDEQIAVAEPEVMDEEETDEETDAPF